MEDLENPLIELHYLKCLVDKIVYFVFILEGRSWLNGKKFREGDSTQQKE